MRHFKGGVADFPGLLAEDGAQQTLLRGQLGLSLGRYLSDQDIARADLGSDADDSPLVQILEGIVADARNVPGDLLRSQLRITGLCLIFLDMHGGVDILLHQTLT